MSRSDMSIVSYRSRCFSTSLAMFCLACSEPAQMEQSTGAPPAQAVPPVMSPPATTAIDASSAAAAGKSAPALRDAALPAALRDAASPAAPRDAAIPSAAQPDAGMTADRVITLHNGGFWNDTRGQRIEAHGAGFIHIDDTWYWIGEDKSQNSANFKSVNCYASHDLSSWEFRNAIITRNTAPELAAADRIIERPKVIYNDQTHEFVMWLHWEGQNYAEAAAGVFTSDSIDGDYMFRRSFRPNNNMSRDDNLFKDDDGKAYFVSAANENADLILYELTADYLDIARQLVTLWPGSKREAPVLFKQAGRYYIITSAATSWDPNQAKYASATAIAGPYTALQNLGNATTYDTQPSYVIPVAGSESTTYIYAADRWQDPDLRSSKYIWLPLKWNGNELALDNYAQWSLNLTTGNWSASVDPGTVPHKAWTLLAVSSEETQAEDGHATRAFDDSSSTFWHTRYTGMTPGYPHEISIDLGAEYDLIGMRYLPRQDGNPNGLIADYEFYVSLDPNDWGAAVSSGTFPDGTTEQKLDFAPKRARYVRLRALSGVGGRVYASVAELNVIAK